jgi:AraC family transcriptional regulator of adaptative response/methylated-DNA-[protein]-cysteine methyltransferase
MAYGAQYNRGGSGRYSVAADRVPARLPGGQHMKAVVSIEGAGFAAPEDAVGEAVHWAAVIARDALADGQFVYAVRTTGVYCRPSCPSRAARRENICFFDTTHAARAAGFRACKRCRPDAAPLALRQADAVLAACRALEASASGIGLAALARASGLSAHHFHRVFKRVTGVTPKAYFKTVQARRLPSALAAASNVTEAIYAAGFNSAGRFYENGAAALGMTPLAYRGGGAGQSIQYAVEPCSLGFVIVAATSRGVCGIELGDAAQDLIEALRLRFPKAQFAPGDAQFRHWVGAVLAYIEHPQGLLDLPCDVQGTVFQQRVWQALRAIPSGSTVSYAELAGAIGRPTAARAVAQACASNPLAVAVPCHRVVRADGALSGYRWGVARKAELLRRESEQSGVPHPVP